MEKKEDGWEGTLFSINEWWVDYIYLEQRERDYIYSRTAIASWWSADHWWSVRSKKVRDHCFRKHIFARKQ